MKVLLRQIARSGRKNKNVRMPAWLIPNPYFPRAKVSTFVIVKKHIFCTKSRQYNFIPQVFRLQQRLCWYLVIRLLLKFRSYAALMASEARNEQSETIVCNRKLILKQNERSAVTKYFYNVQWDNSNSETNKIVRVLL